VESGRILLPAALFVALSSVVLSVAVTPVAGQATKVSVASAPGISPDVFEDFSRAIDATQ
jgi:hypothetical protein